MFKQKLLMTVIVTSLFCLETQSKVIEVTKDNLKKEVLENKAPVVLDVYAKWCPPCQRMKPIFEELASNFNNCCVFAKMDIDKTQNIAGSLGIETIPTFVIFHKGKVVTKLVGSRSEDQLKQDIANALKILHL